MKAGKKFKERRRGLMTVRFSIGAKLITIITIIVLVSLGSITVLESWLIREDLRIAAEENNFEVNRRSAAEAEYILLKMRSDSQMLMQTVNALGADSRLAKETVSFFFEQNPQIAAFVFALPGKAQERFVNERFFVSRGIGADLADSFCGNNLSVLMRAAAGETALLNAAPHFGISVLALFFPWRGGAGAVLLSPASLNDSFGYGTNQSILLNSSGDILIHADFQQVRAGANMADQDFIRSMYGNPDRNKQMLIELDDESGRDRPDTTIRGIILVMQKEIKQFVRPAFNAVCRFLRIETKRNIQTSDAVNKVRYYLAYTKLNVAGSVVITSIEYDKVFEGIAATTRRSIYLTAGVLFISIMLVWFFAKSISVPLKALASAARTIEGGKFEMQLRPKGRDEIGVLTASFQRMCTALGIFGRFTNREIAIKAMRGEIKPGGLPKHATIFFSDIRGFTEKSENFTKVFKDDASDRIVYWLNSYLTCMVECVEKTGGVVDKFIGDAVMAHWGTAYSAGSPGKDAYRCIVAALMMRKALYVMNKKRKGGDPGDPPICIGCGINTGVVTAGQIGSDLRMEYTVIGDPVNLASRTESLNKPLGTDILITEDTWRLVKGKFITEEMPPVTVKGKEKPVRIFAIVNFSGTRKGPRTLAEVRRRLGIEAPDISKVDVNADEHKYQIGGKTGVKRNER
jgi:adenylate cyclase